MNKAVNEHTLDALAWSINIIIAAKRRSSYRKTSSSSSNTNGLSLDEKLYYLVKLYTSIGGEQKQILECGWEKLFKKACNKDNSLLT